MYFSLMNKKKLIQLCLELPDALETYPFKDKANSEYAVLRHKDNGKWFGLVFFLEDKLCINLKCDPFESAMLRDNYFFIKPAWHMNKAHWIMVDVNNAPQDLLRALIKNSYDLTNTKKKNI